MKHSRAGGATNINKSANLTPAIGSGRLNVVGGQGRGSAIERVVKYTYCKPLELWLSTEMQV